MRLVVDACFKMSLLLITTSFNRAAHVPLELCLSHAVFASPVLGLFARQIRSNSNREMP